MEKLCKVLEMELRTYSPVSLKLVFEKIKFKVLLYNQHDFRLAYLKALLLTFQPFGISTFQISSHIVMVILKVTNISLFIKVGAANFLLKLNYLQSREETQYGKIFIIPSNIKHFIERSSVILNFRVVKNRYHRDFQYLMVSIHFFHKIV